MTLDLTLTRAAMCCADHPHSIPCQTHTQTSPRPTQIQPDPEPSFDHKLISIDNAKKSSSYKLLDQGSFEIQYGTAGSDVQGDYISDTISFGGATVKKATMAVANKVSNVPTGIMGIGFDSNEAIVAEGGKAYKSIVDTMVSEGVINTKAYSLWLNDLCMSFFCCC